MGVRRAATREVLADGDLNNDDARFAIAQLSASVTHADSKATILSAALTLLLASITHDHQRAVSVFPPHNSRDLLAAAAVLVAALSTTLALGLLLFVIQPKVRLSHFSRYSWPSLVSASIADLIHYDTVSDRREAWETAIALATIARRKYRALKAAFIFWAIGAATFFLATFLLP